MLLALWPAFPRLSHVRARQLHERLTIDSKPDPASEPTVYPVQPDVEIRREEAVITSKQKTDDAGVITLLLAMMK